MQNNYTIVVGVDREHLEQLRLVYPTWVKHKPELRESRMIVFFDETQVLPENIIEATDFHEELRLVPLPSPSRCLYVSQREKMLAGFVHVPALFVETPYWLKLDTDTVATGIPNWISNDWFHNDPPAIVAHRWGYTKPPEQMVELDKWVTDNPCWLSQFPPLNLHPARGSKVLGHSRIISFCGFFETHFSKQCASCLPNYSIPVPSQDGFHWYCATRVGRPVIRANMKALGWSHFRHEDNIKKAVQESLL
jgi:hypothetical protein